MCRETKDMADKVFTSIEDTSVAKAWILTCKSVSGKGFIMQTKNDFESTLEEKYIGLIMDQEKVDANQR